MDDRAAWLEARRTGIGGSDSAALFGVHPYSSLTKLWAEKTGRLPPDEDSIRLRWGRRLEAGILAEYEHVSGYQLADQADIVPDRIADVLPGAPMLRHPDLPTMLGNTDAIVICPDRGPGVVDAKTVHPRKFGEWITEGRPPLNYLVQLTHYMECAGLRWATIAAFTGVDDDLYVYELDFDAERGARIMELIDTFWRRYVVRDQQPPADSSKPTADTVRKIYPKDLGRVVQLTGPAAEWAAEFDELSVEIRELEKRRDAAKTKLIATLGDATAGTLDDGSGFTFKAGKRGRSLRRASAKAMRKHTG